MSLSCYVLLHNKYNSYTGFVSENNPAQLAQIINLNCVEQAVVNDGFEIWGVASSFNLVGSPPPVLHAGGSFLQARGWRSPTPTALFCVGLDTLI